MCHILLLLLVYEIACESTTRLLTRKVDDVCLRLHVIQSFISCI